MTSSYAERERENDWANVNILNVYYEYFKYHKWFIIESYLSMHSKAVKQ